MKKDNKKYSIYFGKEISEYDVVSYITNTNKWLRTTYYVYQDILKSIRNKC